MSFTAFGRVVGFADGGDGGDGDVVVVITTRRHEALTTFGRGVAAV